MRSGVGTHGSDVRAKQPTAGTCDHVPTGEARETRMKRGHIEKVTHKVSP